MSRSYTKRIRATRTPDGRHQVNLYLQSVNGRQARWHVTVARQPVAYFDSASPAVTLLEQIERDGYKPEVDPDRVVELAEAVEAQPGEEVAVATMPLLAELAARLAARKGRSHDYQVAYRTCGHRAGSEPIPTSPGRLENWLVEALGRVTRPARTARLLEFHSNTFASIFRVILIYPQAFPKLLPYVETVASRCKLNKEMRRVGLKAKTSREPLTREEIATFVERCSTIEEVLTTLGYLCFGFRSQEINRLNIDSFTWDGKVVLAEIQTKRKSKQMPLAAAALRAIVAFMVGHQWAHREDIDYLRFRPTTAVYLALSGVPLLEIATRLGHTTQAMLLNHYCKTEPVGYRGPVEQYLGIGPIIVGGHRVDENHWDRWILRTTLEQAKRFGILEIMKKHVLECFEQEPLDLPMVAEF